MDPSGNTTFLVMFKCNIWWVPSTEFVYGIFRESKYLYIGQTTCGPRRFMRGVHPIKLHGDEIKDTDQIHIWITPNFLRLERELIKQFRPTYNKQVL